MDGSIWLATGRGVRKFVDGNWTSYRKGDGLNHETISSILIRDDGSVWVGSFGGVCRLVEDSWQCMTTVNGLVHDKVYDLVEDSEDNLWFATDAGISKFDGITWTNYTTENGLSHNRILCLLVDSQGWIWAGHPHGVDRWDGSAWTNFNEPFDYKVVRDIIEVPEGHIWFASNSLVHFDGNQFSNFDAGISPLDYYISFTLDKLGRLWVGTDKSGIYILDQLTTNTKKIASSALTVFPNPTTASLFVELLKGTSKAQRLTIHNLYGQKLLEMELSDHHEFIQLDLSSYANGAYLVSLLRDHNISTHRVVVHK
jgi:ligand-binding sensor domain-containing protein